MEPQNRNLDKNIEVRIGYNISTHYSGSIFKFFLVQFGIVSSDLEDRRFENIMRGKLILIWTTLRLKYLVYIWSKNAQVMLGQIRVLNFGGWDDASLGQILRVFSRQDF